MPRAIVEEPHIKLVGRHLVEEAGHLLAARGSTPSSRRSINAKTAATSVSSSSSSGATARASARCGFGGKPGTICTIVQRAPRQARGSVREKQGEGRGERGEKGEEGEETRRNRREKERERCDRKLALYGTLVLYSTLGICLLYRPFRYWRP
eukprot:scaffold75229_cov31-Tisochrysis_lutea.AAC.1